MKAVAREWRSNESTERPINPWTRSYRVLTPEPKRGRISGFEVAR